jgi:hypothetical protein
MEYSCFAFDLVKKRCRVLKDTSFCCGPHCPFRKSVADYESSRQKADRRLARLPEEMQSYIAEKYHDSVRLWQKPVRKAVNG